MRCHVNRAMWGYRQVKHRASKGHKKMFWQMMASSSKGRQNSRNGHEARAPQSGGCCRVFNKAERTLRGMQPRLGMLAVPHLGMAHARLGRKTCTKATSGLGFGAGGPPGALRFVLCVGAC